MLLLAQELRALHPRVSLQPVAAGQLGAVVDGYRSDRLGDRLLRLAGADLSSWPAVLFQVVDGLEDQAPADEPRRAPRRRPVAVAAAHASGGQQRGDEPAGAGVQAGGIAVLAR